MRSLFVPGLRPTRPWMTCASISDELLSLTSVGSARTMSPGRPAISVPPSLALETADSDGAGPEAAGWPPGGAPEAAPLVPGDGDAEVPQAANSMDAATSIAIWIRIMIRLLLLFCRLGWGGHLRLVLAADVPRVPKARADRRWRLVVQDLDGLWEDVTRSD